MKLGDAYVRIELKGVDKVKNSLKEINELLNKIQETMKKINNTKLEIKLQDTEKDK
ncbi:unnamed protein product [marine sediment metagenome]|uniref:Uncharacterized protein n=1 Tax=marine sediment metagenome TaxID=412755 RepID=X1KH69_9ZZZZ